jgi:hypothetical protein
VDHATEAGCATLRLEGDNDEKSCRDADSLTSCRWGKGHGRPGGGDGGGGSYRASALGEGLWVKRERERCMGCGQPLDGAREAKRREREVTGKEESS